MLGARIAALRRQANMSQSELAQRIQVSPSAVGMYEQGRREPSVRTLIALSRCLGVSLEYLMTGEISPAEIQQIHAMLACRMQAAEARLDRRPDRPFSRQELTVLFAAMLMDTEEEGEYSDCR
jgi:transcriptional regulator with XRE-family HTH domain